MFVVSWGCGRMGFQIRIVGGVRFKKGRHSEVLTLIKD